MGSLFRSLGMVVWAVRSAIPCSTRAAIWIPFLVIGLVQAACLWLLMSFHSSIVLPLAAPVIHAIVGDAGLHYPTFYLALPLVYSRVALVLSVLTSIAIAAATIMFAGVFRGRDWRSPWRAAWKRYPALLLVTAVLVVALYLVSKLAGLVPVQEQEASRIARWGTRVGLLLLFVLVQSFLVYATAWIVLRGSSALAALGKSIRLASSTIVTTGILVAVPVLCIFPFDYLSSRSDLMLTKFRPELVAGILGVEILGELILGFVLVGAITRVFIYQVEESA